MNDLICYLNDNGIIAFEEPSDKSSNSKVLRANLNEVSEVENFMLLYHEFTKTQWIRFRQLDNPSR